MSLIFGILGLCVLSTAQEGHICKAIDHLHQKERERGKSLLDFRSSQETSNYDVNYHRMHWEIDPTEYYIKGNVVTYFTVLEKTDEIYFDFSDLLEVKKVLRNGDTLNFEQLPQKLLRIEFSESLNNGSLDSVEIIYEGEPEQTGFSSFVTGEHNGVPIMWTLSEPYGSRDWWPCKQSLNDKIDSIDIFITTPKAFRGASNGLLISENLTGDQITYHWRHRYPIPAYLVAMAVTDYYVYTNKAAMPNGDSLVILNYVYPESKDQAMSDTRVIVPLMEFFSDRFGIYPFVEEKYGHAQFGWGGGIEHQTMSFMGGFGFQLQAHELAHQWFGNKVTCGSWQDIWLNEGFATYLTGMAIEQFGPAFWYPWKKGSVDNIVSIDDGSVFVDDTSNVGRIFDGRLTYTKGAYLLHMLRWKLGDELFLQACRNYLEDPRLAFGYARTQHLQEHFEAVAGESLSEFFDDWFYGQGYPSYTITWQQQMQDLKLSINQFTSDRSVDFFEMPVPLKVFGEGRDTILRIDHTIDGQIFEMRINFQIDSIQFDPDLWLISKNNTVVEGTLATKVGNGHVDVVQNPFGTQLVLKFDASVKGNTFVIFSEGGRTLFKGVANTSMTIQTEDWPSGAYFVELPGFNILPLIKASND